MCIRVFDGEAFGSGGGVEGLVGRNQDDRVEAARLIDTADFERSGELHGIVGPKRVCIRQFRGTIQ